jgi:hypothetical protein
LEIEVLVMHREEGCLEGLIAEGSKGKRDGKARPSGTPVKLSQRTGSSCDLTNEAPFGRLATNGFCHDR